MIITDDDRAVAKMIGDWLKKEAVPVCAEFDAKNEFPQKLYDGMVELGLNLVAVPESYGGLGLNTVAQSLIYEELGRYEPGLGSAVGVNSSACHLLNLYGNDEQKKIFFDILTGGGWAAFCLTEPGAGSDAASIATTAVEDGDDYIINGTKCFSTSAPIAGVYTVFATVDKSLGLKGITCFLVERDRPGLSIGKHEDKLGIRLSLTSDVVFQDMRIPKSHMIGNIGDGFKIAMGTLNESRICVGAIGVGLASRAMEEAASYAKTRVQFKRPIADLQAIQMMLADMAIEIEAARQLVYYTSELVDAGRPYTMFSSICKTKGSDVAMRVTTDALQVVGGYGYMKEYPMEKMFRDAKILQIYEGTNQIQRLTIARELFKATK
jgi:butyryl-CoA dehydrogenase